MKKKIRKIVYPLLLLFILYIISGMILAKRQRQIIFKPVSLDRDFVFDPPSQFQAFNIEVKRGESLNILHLYREDTAKGQILYFHGNSGNIQTYLPALTSFLQKGYNVFIVDYPGYGKSTGTPTEKSINESAEVLYQLGTKYMSPDSTIIYGKGLGGAVAAYLASEHSCRAAILVSPFYSLYDIAHHYFPIYPVKKYLKGTFPVYHYVQRIAAPVFLFHGKKDRVIPFSQAKELSELLYKKDRFISLPKATHQNVIQQPLYKSVMDSLLR